MEYNTINNFQPLKYRKTTCRQTYAQDCMKTLHLVFT